MSNLRWFGLMVGILGFILTFRFYRGPKWNKSNVILFSMAAVMLIAISIDPDILNFLRDMFFLKQAKFGRILALLIVSNIFLLFYSFNNKSKLDAVRIQIDHIFRKLGRPTSENLVRQEIKPITIVIPAYNESDNLQELLPAIPSRINGLDVGALIIDDGSEDDTADIPARLGYPVVSNLLNRGGGAALRLGYDMLRKTECRICVTMDADFQHDPHEISRLVSPILEDQYDFVIGSRVIGSREKDDALRYTGVLVFGRLISLLLGVRITDPSSGFRAFKLDILRDVRLYEDQYHTSELIIEAVKNGLRIGEVPITIRKRKHGKSKKGVNWMYGLSFAKVIIKSWWR